ncbi:hypothetical protein RSal33209_3383 [Renibacterium salmoninarum ATCC 33209]|uniref:Thioester domain-containing protein n=2 Tax=Renibacterium salmoninarum TaxID=1646 RepID=A9WV72_RENSM|nr:hypothetical protein RSal33209_3383 [Renibacterium salmoninarum ATCC 33209]
MTCWQSEGINSFLDVFERQHMKSKIGVALVAIWALVGLSGLGISPAQALTPSWSFGAGLGNRQIFVGQQKNSDGLITYCTDYELLAPNYAGNYRPAQAGGFIRNDGSALSAAENGALSYLLYRWGASPENETAAAVQLSIWALSSSGRAWGSPGMAEILNKAKLPDSVVSLGKSLTEMSLKYAGPYRISVDVGGKVAATIGVLSGQNTLVPGLAVAASVSGDLKLSDPDSTGKTSWVSEEQPRSFGIQRTGLGQGSLTAVIDKAP